MSRILAVIAAFVLFISYGSVRAAKPSKPAPCQNTRLFWEMLDNYTPAGGTFTSSLITGDGSAYVDGSSGVSAVLQLCSGSGDATLQVSGKGKSARSVKFNFGSMVATNSATPAWATGLVSGSGNINVRGLAFEFQPGDRATEYEFTTWMGSTPPAPSGSWGFHMLHPVTDARVGDPGDPNFPTANFPYVEAAVRVHHCPANSSATSGPCLGRVKETWIVNPDPSPTTYSDGSPAPPTVINVGELINKDNLSSPVNAGQFSMPFQFVISVL